MAGYKEDLAYIHDVGHGGFARRAAPGLLRMLRRNGLTGCLVVDLGCGSGIWARELVRAGYDVLGVDISASMIRLARDKTPKARFVAASLWRVKLPSCDAVTAIGECVNYCFDRGNSRRALGRLFRRVYRCLRPGGIFVFDVAEPGQLPDRRPQRAYSQGKNWAVLREALEDGKKRILTRRITSFRRIGQLYRRSEETHRLRLYDDLELIAELRRAGFRARLLRGYGSLRLPRAHAAFLARKPRVHRSAG